MNFKGFYYLYLKETKRFLIVWSQTLLGPLVVSLLFLFVFVIALGKNTSGAPIPEGVSFISFLIPGIIMMLVTQNSFANSASSVLLSKVFGTINDVLAAPLSYRSIVLSYILASCTRGLLIAFTISIVSSIITDFSLRVSITQFFIALYFIIVSSFILGAFGIIAGLWSSNFDRMATITNLIIMPLSFLSGTFYSIEGLPYYIKNIVYFNPIFYMIDGFRYAFNSVSDFNVIIESIILLVLAVLLYWLCVLLLKVGYKIKS